MPTKLLKILTLSLLFSSNAFGKELINASYALSKDLFTEYNQLFKNHWFNLAGEKLEPKIINDASSTQVKNIIRGLKADVVTFNQASDIEKLVKEGLVEDDWQEKFPNNSVPYYSTVAFVVRKGNPKNIANWNDLTNKKVSFIFPNPKTSGNGRYSVVAALLYAHETYETEAERDDFMNKFISHLATVGEGGKKTTNKFLEVQFIDALLTFEAEANFIKEKYPEEGFEVVVPPISILAEFPVAVVDKVVDEKNSRNIATEYLNYLYNKEIQTILANKFHYRVGNKEIMKKQSAKFPEVKLINASVLGNWSELMKVYFSKGGKWDEMLGE